MPVNARKEAVPFRYFSDGSGRDSYVASDNGGLIPKYPSRGYMQEFTDSLRQPEAPRYVGTIAQKMRKQKFYHTNHMG